MLLDEGCPIDEFSAFCDAHPDREVVLYANTSAATKPGRTGRRFTSVPMWSDTRFEQDKVIICATTPRHHVQRVGGRCCCGMVLCIVHEEFESPRYPRSRQFTRMPVNGAPNRWP